MASAGADVYGIDIDMERIGFARNNLRERYMDVVDRVRFDAIEISDVMPDQSFDLAVSKDTFEHVSEIGAVASELYRLLKPGGELWAGFSPLYWSPRATTGSPASRRYCMQSCRAPSSSAQLAAATGTPFAASMTSA